MAKPTPHKKQHWVPQSYLKPGCDPQTPAHYDPYVWCFSKDGETVKNKAPENIFFERELYTIHRADGTRDLTVEHGLAGLEDAFVRIREDKLAERAPLTPDEHLLVRAFVAAMRSRTRGHLEHQQRQWKDVLEMMDAMRESVEAKSPEEQEELARVMGATVSSGPSLSYKEVEGLAKDLAGPTVVTMTQTQLPILARMTLTVLTTTDSLGFITSDMPCVWFDPELYKLPPLYRAPGLGSRTIEVTLPVSPEQMLLLTWRPLREYIEIDTPPTDELNRRTRFYCDEYFVVKRKEKRDIWFDSGQPPVS